MMKTEKRILSLLLCVLLLVTLLPRMQITSRAATVADLSYTISDEKVYITGCDTSASGELVIPAEIEGYPVTTISDRAFSLCASLTSITIPNSVTTIKPYAFMNGTGLTDITFCGSAPTFEIAPYDDGSYCFDNVTATAHYPCGDESWTDEVKQNYGGTITWEAAHTYENGICTGCGEVTILYSGTCGEEAYWTLDAAGKLTVSGTGEMEGYSSSADAPWYNYRSSIQTVEVCEGITSIGNCAFCDCTSLTDVTLPESIISIAAEAFCNCTSLTGVTIPEGVAFIEWATFRGCSSLTDVMLPESIISIEDEAFCNCISLTDVMLPESIISIEDEAFCNCISLTNVTIPESVTSIGLEAFACCSSLTSVTIPGGVTFFDWGVFRNCSSLTDVTISEGMTRIGDAAFFGCSSLTDVTIPDSVTVIGNYAFSDCTNLTSVTIPESVTTIEANAFTLCRSLTDVTIPSGITTIEAGMFTDCRSLTYVVIPAGVTDIEDDAFAFCTSLSSITFFGVAPSFGTRVFADVTATACYPCGDETWTDIENQDYGGTITWEAAHTYENGICTGCGEVTILYSGTCGEEAYWTLDAAGKLTVSGTGEMEGYTSSADVPRYNYRSSITTYAPWYEYRSMITEVVIEDGISNVGDFAFQDCSNLTSVTIPEAVTEIGHSAFAGCISLTSVVIPDQVAVIDTAAFGGCTGLYSVTLSKNLTRIGDEAFSGCDNLTAIAIPDGVTAIGEYAFSYCESLAEITFGEGLLTIGEGAFIRCPVTAVILPASVTKVGSCAFDRCGSLSSITFLGAAPTFVSNCFAEVTATAYYPCNDETWTDDVKQDYYGTITWEAAHTYENGICTGCGAADPDYVEPVVTPTIALQYPTLVFEDVILMNVYFTASDLEDVVEMGLLTYTAETSAASVDTADAVIPGYAWSNTDRFYYATTNGIAAKDLGDEIYFAVYAKLADGTYTYTRVVSYSPAKYAYASLATGSAAMKPIVVAMLNYGAAAQSYFNYKTDALVNANLTAEQSALVESYRSDMITAVASPSDAKQGALTHNGGYTRRYPTVSFEGAFCINYYAIPAAAPADGITMYYWTQEDYDGAEVLTLENATAAIPMAGEGIGEYHAAVEGIAAKDLSKGVYVCFVYTSGSTTYYSGVLAYSIGSYCAAQAGGVATSAALAQATAVYGYYANELFN